MGGSGGAAVPARRSRHPFDLAYIACIACCMHLFEGSHSIVIVTAEDTNVMLLCLAFQKDMISPVPHIRSVGHRTAHDWLTSANWPGHCETASVTALLGYMSLQAATP